jgi:hypothetical protein
MQLKTEQATAASPEGESVLLLLIGKAVYCKVKLLRELPD